MRSPDVQQDSLISSASPESRVQKDIPFRATTDAALGELDQDFNAMYSSSAGYSILLQKLLRAHLLIAFRTIRGKRQLMVQIDNGLLRRLVGFSMDNPAWGQSTAAENRDRPLSNFLKPTHGQEYSSACFFERE